MRTTDSHDMGERGRKSVCLKYLARNHREQLERPRCLGTFTTVATLLPERRWLFRSARKKNMEKHSCSPGRKQLQHQNDYRQQFKHSTDVGCRFIRMRQIGSEEKTKADESFTGYAGERVRTRAFTVNEIV